MSHNCRSEITSSSSGCRVIEANLGVGLSNCNWTSCLEGCTRELFKCFQIKVEVEDDEWWELIRENQRRRAEEEKAASSFFGDRDGQL